MQDMQSVKCRFGLNNGVTVLASDASAPGGKELVIHNPEIVNGLQTSTEIYHYFKSNEDNIEKEERDILLRIIVPENDETRDNIIRATNSQTAIPKASLRATDHVHRQIEEFLKNKGLFYDRRKNFYRNEGKKPREIISIPFLSQCLISVIMQKPNYARARPSTLLDDEEAYGKLFHTNNDLEMYHLVASWGRKIEIQLKASNDYTTVEVNDIKFYVLYVCVCNRVNNVYPSNNRIIQLQNKQLTNSDITTAAALVYDEYQNLGGTDKIAKGATLIDNIKAKLRATFSE
ncbi:MAG: AIPR family protein [Deltaproteobacteria bacterium]|nr:AIPR family protein [Deltaproteobacteria bacterium]